MQVIKDTKPLSQLEQAKEDVKVWDKKVDSLEKRIKKLQEKAQKAQEEYQKAVEPHIEKAKRFEAKMKEIHGELMIANQGRFKAETIFNYLNEKPKIITNGSS